jgi:hypothetical protein
MYTHILLLDIAPSKPHLSNIFRVLTTQTQFTWCFQGTVTFTLTIISLFEMIFIFHLFSEGLSKLAPALMLLTCMQEVPI